MDITHKATWSVTLEMQGCYTSCSWCSLELLHKRLHSFFTCAPQNLVNLLFCFLCKTFSVNYCFGNTTPWCQTASLTIQPLIYCVWEWNGPSCCVVVCKSSQPLKKWQHWKKTWRHCCNLSRLRARWKVQFNIPSSAHSLKRNVKIEIKLLL